MATPPPPRHSRSSPRPRSRLCCKHGPSEPPWCTAPPEWIDRRPACTCAELLLHDVIRACAPPGVMALSAMVEHRPPRHGRHCIVRYQVDREQFLRCLLARCSPRRIAYGCTVLMRLTWGRRALNARALCGPHAHASQGYVGHPRHAGVITLPLARLKPHSPGEAAGPSRPQRQRGGVSARKRKQAQAAASHPTRPPARGIPSSARIPPPRLPWQNPAPRKPLPPCALDGGEKWKRQCKRPVPRHDGPGRDPNGPSGVGAAPHTRDTSPRPMPATTRPSCYAASSSRTLPTACPGRPLTTGDAAVKAAPAAGRTCVSSTAHATRAKPWRPSRPPAG